MLVALQDLALRVPLATLDRAFAAGVVRLGRRLNARACIVDCVHVHQGSTCCILPQCWYVMDNCDPSFACDCSAGLGVTCNCPQ